MGRFFEIPSHGIPEAQESYLRQSLERAMEGSSLYKTPDIPTLENATIPPGETVDVRFGFNPSILQILQWVPLQALDYMSVSVRSRWAQAGLDIGNENGNAQLRRGPGNNFDFWERKHVYVASMPVSNLSRRPIRIEEGSRLFRLYWLNPQNRLGTSEILGAIRSGDVRVEGDDWRIHSTTNPSTGEETAYLYVPVFARTFRAVDPDNVEPFTISDSSPTFGRRDVDQQLKPVKPHQGKQLLIGETPSIFLAKHLNGELHFATENPITGAKSKHGNSRLLDGGVTDHNVRVEISTEVREKVMDDGVFIDLYADR